MLLLLFVIGSCYGENFTNHMFLDPLEKYEMWWNFTNEEITVKLRVETLGWIGWGLSPNGKMEGSDILLAWFENGKPKLQDSHAIIKAPVADADQDYDLIEMSRLEGNTTVIFKRKLLLCNSEDISITTDTTRLIWSYGDSDSPQYHENNRNTHSVLLVNYVNEGDKNALPKDHIIKELRMINTSTLEKKDTMYKCVGFKVWDLPQRHHLIRVEPIVEKGHENLVHHIILYECTGSINTADLNYQHTCKGPNMPEGFETCISVIIHAWAIGGTTMNYPKEAGLSFGGPNDPAYLVMEVHYDNPSLLENLKDSSGLRFYLTPTLRQYDATVLTFGVPVRPDSIIIPQNQDSFTWRSFCSSTCLNVTEDKVLKPQVFASLLHSHLAGRKLIARLVRDTDGVETKRIAQDLNYDFNFQEVKTFSEPLEIPSGHSLYLDCVYTTMGLSKPTVGGESTKEEMCVGFLWYYPASAISGCLSINTPTFGEFQTKELNWIINRYGYINQTLIIDGKNYSGQEAWKPLLEPSIWTDDLVTKWQQYQKLPSYSEICIGKNNRLEPLTPKLTATLADSHCVVGVSNGIVLKQDLIKVLVVFAMNFFICYS